MSIITKNPHAWFICTNSSGKTQTIYNNNNYDHDYPFGFTANFSDRPTPPINTVTLYNLSKKHKNFYRINQKCSLGFNWGEDKKIISEGYISKIDTHQTDGVTDTTVITFTEGTNYNNVKARKLKVSKSKKVNGSKTVKKRIPGHWTRKRVNHHLVRVYVKGRTVNKRVKTRTTKKMMVNKAFRKGTSYKSIISGIASTSGIKIANIDLAKNPKIKKAYTAKGKPLSLIKKLVSHTGSKMTYIRGKLEIINPRRAKRTWYHIDDKDLIQPPSFNQSNARGDKGTWEITTPLVPEITFNVGIIMESKYLKGKYYVRAGQHTSDGDSPQTQCTLEKL